MSVLGMSEKSNALLTFLLLIICCGNIVLTSTITYSTWYAGHMSGITISASTFIVGTLSLLARLRKQIQGKYRALYRV